MAKNIIICSDGTGNKSNKDRGTNVFKLYEAIDLHNQQEQIAIYDDGVGTNSFKLLRILGGAFGFGLARNVRQLYVALARVYQPGDKIFLFGFSRGAFTIRFLAGLINKLGIIDVKNSAIDSDAELNARAYQAFREYHRINQASLEYVYGFIIDTIKFFYGFFNTRFYRAKDADKFRKQFSVSYTKDKNPIHFIGVWDTVCAVGFPLRDIASTVNKYVYHFTFSDHYLNPYIKNAYHALSIDDQRKTFSPYLWNNKNIPDKTEEDKQARKKQTIEQVWFSGMHSNVGGGYPRQGMSLAALNWMLRKAESCGMEIIDGDKMLYKNRQNINDKMYDSRSGINFIYRYAPRDISKLCNDYALPVHIHASVFNRIIRGTEAYAPGNIPTKFEMVDRDEEKCKWPNISQDMQAELQGDTSYLTKVEKFISARKWLNRLFIITFIYLLYRALLEDMNQNGITGVFSFLLSDKMIGSLIKQPLWIFAILIISFSFSIIVKQITQTRFSKCWFTLIAKYYPGYK